MRMTRSSRRISSRIASTMASRYDNLLVELRTSNPLVPNGEIDRVAVHGIQHVLQLGLGTVLGEPDGVFDRLGDGRLDGVHVRMKASGNQDVAVERDRMALAP